MKYSTRIHRSIASQLALLTTAIAIVSCAEVARPVDLTPGDIIVGANIGTSSSADWSLLEIDPQTGNRTIISDLTHGSGVPFSAPSGISFLPDGSLLVADDNDSALFRVDPATGDRTIITSNNTDYLRGTGVLSGYIEAQQFGDAILMSGSAIVSVDPVTGDRTLVSGSVDFPVVSAGLGPDLNASGFVISGTDLFAASNSGTGLLKVDTLTGDRTTISDTGIGSGPVPSNILDVEYDNAGNFLVSTLLSGTIFRIDPVTGNRTIVSGGGVGSGPRLPYASQIGVMPSGTLVVGGLLATSVLTIDPATGNRTILSDTTHGTGPGIIGLEFGCTVVPQVPEPSTLVLALIGCVAVIFMRLKSRRVYGLQLGT